jgi:hypothetical protein
VGPRRTSDFIRKRLIVPQRSAHDDIEVPVQVTEAASEAYERCLARLRRWSLVALHLVVTWAADAFDLLGVAAAST